VGETTTHRRPAEKPLFAFASRSVRPPSTAQHVIQITTDIDVMWWQHNGNTLKPELSCATYDYRMIRQTSSAIRVILGHVNNL
jgi:hypothetical protein